MLPALQTRIIISILAATKLHDMDNTENKEKSVFLKADNVDADLQEVKPDEVEEDLLTKREKEILEWIGHGKSQKEIAEILHLAPKTVDKHISNMKEKYNISKCTEMMGLYTCVKKSKKFDVELLRQYGLQIFFILINLCDGGTPRL